MVNLGVCVVAQEAALGDIIFISIFDFRHKVLVP